MRVDFEAVTVTFGGNEVVRNASASIASGEVVGLVGPNGSGKSSLLRTLYRAVVPHCGMVRVDGQNVRRLTGRQAARTVAVMLQDAPTDFDLTVDELVMLGRAPHHSSFGRDSAEDITIVEKAMQRVGVEELADRMISTLSGGQRQRVMLARALAQQAPVLVLDEPSNHLDIAHQLELMTIVRSLGRTVIAALHDLNLAAQYCDRVIVLQHGHIVANGAPRTVLNSALINEVFRVDARLVADGVLAFRHLPYVSPTTPVSAPHLDKVSHE